MPTDKRLGRTVFWLGLLLYGVSFFLFFVGGRGVYTPKPPSGADCAIDWFFLPWVYVHLHGMGSFWTDAPIENVSIAISGWINLVFVLAILFQSDREDSPINQNLAKCHASYAPLQLDRIPLLARLSSRRLLSVDRRDGVGPVLK